MAFKKATISIDDWLKSTGATERPRAKQDTADAQKPVTKPISEPVPQKKKENISFWEKLLNAFGDAGARVVPVARRHPAGEGTEGLPADSARGRRVLARRVRTAGR